MTLSQHLIFCQRLRPADHSTILLGVQKIEKSRKGPGYWKLKTSLLANENYINMIKTEMPTWIEDGKVLVDERSKWGLGQIQH